MRPIPWLARVRVSDYRSLADVDVRLAPLTVLVGPNGSGKSNFLDALRFLSEAVATSPYQAVESRGGLPEILRRSDGRASSFTVSVDVRGDAAGTYEVTVSRRHSPGRRPIEISSERCVIGSGSSRREYSVHSGSVDAPGLRLPTKNIEDDRLLLPLVATTKAFAPLARLLESMVFYHLEPRVMRNLDAEIENAILGPRGEHLGDVLGSLAAAHPVVKERIDEYLGVVVPGLRHVDRQYAAGYVTLAMRQHADGEEITFGPDAMSDGTVRATGVLAALFQPSTIDGQTSLVGIEEPELALHPAAAGVLFDALTEASGHVQVIATSQSADLLDRDDIDAASIRAVRFHDGRTEIGELDEASARIVADRRLTLGELMRGNQLTPRSAG